MADRDYQAPQFGLRDTRQVQGGQVVQTSPRAQVPLTVGDDSWRDRLIQEIGGQGARVLNQMADLEYTNLYLEGQAKAGVIESEDEIEGNPLTRDWQVAGYRDTMGKLALADAEAQFSIDLRTLRERPPGELQEYLAQRREKLMPGLASMSREARASVAGQLLLQDRAAIKKHRDEHQKYIIETKTQAIDTQWGSSITQLRNEQIKAATQDGSKEAYDETLRSASGMIFGSVWMDESLPLDVKQSLTFSMLERALAEDQPALYDYIRANGMPVAGGGSQTLLNRLTGEQQLKLSGAYRESMRRTDAARNIFRSEQLANITSQIHNKTITMTYGELRDTLRPMVLNNTITNERLEGIMRDFLNLQSEKQLNSQLSEAYLKGDLQGILNSGNSVADARKAVNATLAEQKATPERRLNFWLQAGVNGMDGAFEEAGQQLGVAIRQMRSGDRTMLPQHARTLEAINLAAKQAEVNGHANTRVQLLKGLGDDDRMLAERVFMYADEGAGYSEALQRALKTEEQELALPPGTRAARAQGNQREALKLVDAVEPRGLWETGWLKLKSAFGSQAAQAELATTPFSGVGDRDGWFSDSPTVHEYTAQAKQELSAEVARAGLLSPGANPDQVFRVAQASLAARTIMTDNGPIFLPRGTNIQTAFGVAPGNQSAIGKAIDGMLGNTKEDTRWFITFAQGKVFAQEYKDGQRVGNGQYIEFPAIQARIREDVARQTAEVDAAYGEGRAVRLENGKVLVQNRAGASRRALAAAVNAPLPPELQTPQQAPTGPAEGVPQSSVQQGAVEFSYNGDNKVGVPNEWMLALRDNLVDHEGVRDTAYDDLSGKRDKSGKRIRTVGVGVSSHNPHFPEVGPDGKVSSEGIRDSFLGASDDAAEAGATIAKNLGMYTKAGFSLMSEIAYQSGTAFMSRKDSVGDRYRELAQAMKSGSVKAAEEALTRTAVWRFSRDPKNPDKRTRRQANYLKLVRQAMEGL